MLIIVLVSTISVGCFHCRLCFTKFFAILKSLEQKKNCSEYKSVFLRRDETYIFVLLAPKLWVRLKVPVKSALSFGIHTQVPGN